MGIPHDDEPEKKEAAKKQIYIAAHDLNNVMMAIAGSAELMLEATGDDAQLRAMAERILRASKRGIALVDNLRTLGAVPPNTTRTPSGSSPKDDMALKPSTKMPA